MAELTAQELAQRAGVPAERVQRLVTLGILTEVSEEAGRFESADVERVRVAAAFEEAGMPLEVLGRAIEAGELSLSVLDLLFPQPAALSDLTYRSLCEQAGLTMDLVERLHIGFGLPRPNPDDRIREDDAELLPLLPKILAAGLTEGEVIRGVRMYGENIRRVAECQVQLLHGYMERPLREAGASEAEILERASRMSHQVRPVADRLVAWLYRRHREYYATEHLVAHVEGLLGRDDLPTRTPVDPQAISFLDLSGFTRLTEQEGDESAADLAAALAELVQEASSRHRGRAVKWLGDGVMFHFRRPVDAVRCGLELIHRAPSEGLPPARIGIHAGGVIFREGDYFGRTVNIAARMADYARPSEVLVSEDVMWSSQIPGVAYRKIGPVTLKGLSDPVSLYIAEMSQQ